MEKVSRKASEAGLAGAWGVGLPLVLAGVLSFFAASKCAGQWSTLTPNDTRVEPLYPPGNYIYQTTPSNYDPFQYNWATGRWDYVPIPYAPEAVGPSYSPFRLNEYSGRWDYVPFPQQKPTGMHVAAPPNAPRPVSPDNAPGVRRSLPPVPAPPPDEMPMMPPTTRPTVVISPQATLSFTGKVVSQRVLDIYGDGNPHLLLRLERADGAAGTIDVGPRLRIAELSNVDGKGLVVSASGYLGKIEGMPVLFATEVTFGDVTRTIDRSPVTRPAQ